MPPGGDFAAAARQALAAARLVPVAHAGAVVAMVPVEGCLHQTNEPDTLGRDRTETACTAFRG